MFQKQTTKRMSFGRLFHLKDSALGCCNMAPNRFDRHFTH